MYDTLQLIPLNFLERDRNQERRRDRLMESLEEGDLWQMVNDFIETESSSASPNSYYSASSRCSNQSDSLLNQRTRCFQLQEILNNNKTDEETRVLKIVMTHMRNRMELKKTTKLKRWLVMCLQRNGGFNASLCHTRWPSSSICPSGEYEFVDIIIRAAADHDDKNDDGSQQRLILDVDFKSQFEVARPTKSYSELWSNLPQIFVGSEEKLRKVIRVMCMAAEESMRQRGLHVPPWRKSAYMLSKWLSDFTTSREEEEEKTMIGNQNKLMRDRVTNNDQWGVDGVKNAMKPDNKIGKIDRRRRIAAGAGSSGLAGYFSNLSINCC